MKRFFSALPLALATLLAPTLASAVTFTANLTQDLPDANPGDGVCSYLPVMNPPTLCTLRAAIMEGNATAQGDVDIVLVSGSVHKLTSSGTHEDESLVGDLDVLRPMTITSSGPQNATIDAYFIDRALDFHDTAGTSKIEKINIINGVEYDDHYGACVRSKTTSLTLKEVDISACWPNGYGSHTSAVYSTKKLVIDRSRIHHNGGYTHPSHGVVLQSDSLDLTVIQSTIDNNPRGGISLQGGTFVVDRSTISSNASIGFDAWESNGTINNSTFSGNGHRQLRMKNVNYPEKAFEISVTSSILSGGSSCDVDDGGIALDAKWNVVEDEGCFDKSEEPDDVNFTFADIELSELGYWGGPTPTHVPGAGSDAIDRAEIPLIGCTDPAEDQRGLPRPVPGGASPIPRCDVGAVEVQPSPPNEPQDPPSGPVFADGFENI